MTKIPTIFELTSEKNNFKMRMRHNRGKDPTITFQISLGSESFDVVLSDRSVTNFQAVVAKDGRLHQFYLNEEDRPASTPSECLSENCECSDFCD